MSYRLRRTSFGVGHQQSSKKEGFWEWTDFSLGKEGKEIKRTCSRKGNLGSGEMAGQGAQLRKSAVEVCEGRSGLRVGSETRGGSSRRKYGDIL